MVIPEDQLKNLIIKKKILDEKGFESLVTFAKSSSLSLPDALVQKSILTDEQLGAIVAEYAKLPFITLSKITIPEDVFRIIPEKIARANKMIAFERSKDGIKLATADPSSAFLQEFIIKKTGEKVSVYLATDRDIFNTFQIYRADLQKTFDNMLEEAIGSGEYALGDAPIVKIVDLLINYAYQDRASDIHIEPEEEYSLIRFRIDGILHDVLRFRKHLHDRLTTRIKVLAELRTDEHLSPQDGKIGLPLEEETLDIRVSIIPIVDGEKVVLRLLASKFREFTLTELGMEDKDLQKVTNAFIRSYGMILSTGPTGSGKTTSIYSILKILNTREKNITTIEDPVEYRIKGVNQIQANETNLSFAQGLRSILRQDPNIIFVGEIRDSDTAGIAVNAALTGHLVLSTLHTNDAATALPRLTDMKVEPFLVASTVNVIIAQRLVRKICESCRTPLVITEEEMVKNLSVEIIKKHFTGQKKEIQTFKGKGCKVCHLSGYLGRVGLFEVLEVTKQIRQLITQKADSDVIAQAAIQEGMTTMLNDGLQKVVVGVTTLEEVLRVTRIETS